jgi:hypothetical protein
MFVLCDGMLRSGSTWSFNVALKLLKLSGGRRAFGLYDENPAVLAAARNSRASHLVLKAHTLSPDNYELCRSGAIKAIYTWRDPYDVVASALRIFGKDAGTWLDSLRGALRVWSFHRSTASALIVPYAAILREPGETIAAIGRYLDLPVTAEHLRQIEMEVAFSTVKRFCSRVAQLDAARVVRKDRMVFDRQTLFHQDHIGNGGTGYGLRTLDTAVIEAIDGILREEGFEFLVRSASFRERYASTLAPEPVAAD